MSRDDDQPAKRKECAAKLRAEGRPAPRYCAICGIGPCREPKEKSEFARWLDRMEAFLNEVELWQGGLAKELARLDYRDKVLAGVITNEEAARKLSQVDLAALGHPHV